MYVLLGLELFLIGEATCLDLFVKVFGLIDITGQLWHTLKVKTETLCEEILYTDNITREIVLGIRVSRRGHLREVNNRDVLIIIDKQVRKVFVDGADVCHILTYRIQISEKQSVEVVHWSQVREVPRLGAMLLRLEKSSVTWVRDTAGPSKRTERILELYLRLGELTVTLLNIADRQVGRDRHKPWRGGAMEIEAEPQ
jgi:hypothetical protein